MQACAEQRIQIPSSSFCEVEKAKSGSSTLTTERGDIATWTATALYHLQLLSYWEGILSTVQHQSWDHDHRWRKNTAIMQPNTARACFLTETLPLPADWKEQDRERSSSIKNCSRLQCKVPQSWVLPQLQITSIPSLLSAFQLSGGWATWKAWQKVGFCILKYQSFYPTNR